MVSWKSVTKGRLITSPQYWFSSAFTLSALSQRFVRTLMAGGRLGTVAVVDNVGMAVGALSLSDKHTSLKV